MTSPSDVEDIAAEALDAFDAGRQIAPFSGRRHGFDEDAELRVCLRRLDNIDRLRVIVVAAPTRCHERHRRQRENSVHPMKHAELLDP